MSQVLTRQLNRLQTCAGFLSRLAYERGRQKNIEVDTLLKQSGLSVPAIKDENFQLNVRNQIKFVELVANATGDRLFGFHLAHTYDPREIGLLYYVAASAETLWDSLQRIARYSTVLNEGVVLTLKKGKSFRVRVQYSGVARHTDTHQIEFWIASLIRVFRHLTHRDLKPINVRLMHARGDERRKIAKIIVGNIETGAGVDEIHFPPKSWAFPILTADPYLNRLCVQFCEETLARREAKVSPLKVKVENSIAALLPHGKVRIDMVAAKLGMNSKTLARRLSSEGCAFAEILSNLRFALARRYLADRTLPISKIAWLLGYAESAAFTRAFRRWAGVAPRAARANRQRFV
jgi:AraC-like DNA-binding protein